MASLRSFLTFGLGVAVGALTLALVPFARYEYARIGSDLQRVDRLTGRQEWASEDGWWNMKERDDETEAEAQRFEARAADVVRASEKGRLLFIDAIGRQITVYPKAGKSYRLYGTDPNDPRLAELVRKVGSAGVRTSMDGSNITPLFPSNMGGRPAAMSINP